MSSKAKFIAIISTWILYIIWLVFNLIIPHFFWKLTGSTFSQYITHNVSLSLFIYLYYWNLEFLCIGVCIHILWQYKLTFSSFLQKSAILTTVGVLEQPLGNARLHVARLVAALLQTSDPSICQALCNLSTMDILLVGSAWLDSGHWVSVAPFCHCTDREQDVLELSLSKDAFPWLCVFIWKVASDLHKVSHEAGKHWLPYHATWPKGSGCGLFVAGSYKTMKFCV